MFLYNTERYLAALYSLGGFFSLLSTISMAIVWMHWRVVLNTCAGDFHSYQSYYDEHDCGCILYAKDTLSYFVGSDIWICFWATFASILPLIFCFVFGCYHVYRVCCRSTPPRRAKTELHQRSNEVMQLTVEEDIVEENDISPYYWTPVTIIAIIMVFYTLSHAVTVSDGFRSTCKQYRNTVVKYIQAQGQMVGVIQSRLSCGAIFDFMDYLHQDLSYEKRRDYRINTSIPFILAVVGVWGACICWIGITIVNIMRCRHSRRVRI
ncbi:CLUMA_CG020955, isoform A [Clunio marinus]|uniref:CLUMA_CG020955, isoform A n=1 Tax=Clunio marinus TaxID=568069 RepID=A0A1J1J6Z8_9DIPT|nr:CLUMA_CG020955, isoform A [Clunio marinus]